MGKPSPSYRVTPRSRTTQTSSITSMPAASSVVAVGGGARATGFGAGSGASFGQLTSITRSKTSLGRGNATWSCCCCCCAVALRLSSSGDSPTWSCDIFKRMSSSVGVKDAEHSRASCSLTLAGSQVAHQFNSLWDYITKKMSRRRTEHHVGSDMHSAVLHSGEHLGEHVYGSPWPFSSCLSCKAMGDYLSHPT
jgi:hypothetical protein